MEVFTVELDYVAIGERIRIIRKAKGFTQEKLCEKLDISKTHISRIETGRTKLSLSLLVNIANYFGVTADNLLCDNLGAALPIFKEEIESVLAGSTVYELKCMIEAMKLVKKHLKEKPEKQE